LSVFRVQGSGCRVQGAGFGVQGAGFRVQGSGFRVQGVGCRAHLRPHGTYVASSTELGMLSGQQKRASVLVKGAGFSFGGG